jgi:hypothetical protein
MIFGMDCESASSVWSLYNGVLELQYPSQPSSMNQLLGIDSVVGKSGSIGGLGWNLDRHLGVPQFRYRTRMIDNGARTITNIIDNYSFNGSVEVVLSVSGTN